MPKRQKEKLFSHRRLKREKHPAAGVQGGEHGRVGVPLTRHLGMAVGALQKAGVSMTGQLRHGLLVDAAVQQGGDEEVTQGVEMILLREADGVVDFSQTFGEGVGVEQLPLLVDEQIGTEISAALGGLLRQPPAVAEQHAAQSGGEDDLAAAPVFGGAFHDALAGYDTAGATDGEKKPVTTTAKVRPFQGAQLSTAAAGGHGQQIEDPEMPRLLCERLQQPLGFFDGGDELFAVPGGGQVDHARWVLLDDLIALGVAEHCGNDRQILLRRPFLYRLPATGPLAQFQHHIFQSHRTEFVQLDAPYVGIDDFQHTAIAGQRAGRVFCLPCQPAESVFLESHLTIFAVTVFHFPLKLLGGVGHILTDAALGNIRRDLNGLCFADFPAVRTIPIADGDFIFTRRELLDTGHPLTTFYAAAGRPGRRSCLVFPLPPGRCSPAAFDNPPRSDPRPRPLDDW